MPQYDIEMRELPEDWRPIVRERRTRAYRFDNSSPANLVDQIALTTDLGKSEFVSYSIRLGAFCVRILGADVLRMTAFVTDDDMERFSALLTELRDIGSKKGCEKDVRRMTTYEEYERMPKDELIVRLLRMESMHRELTSAMAAIMGE